MHNAQCTMHNAQFTKHNAQFTMHNARWNLATLQCSIHTPPSRSPVCPYEDHLQSHPEAESLQPQVSTVTIMIINLSLTPIKTFLTSTRSPAHLPLADLPSATLTTPRPGSWWLVALWRERGPVQRGSASHHLVSSAACNHDVFSAQLC